MADSHEPSREDAHSGNLEEILARWATRDRGTLAQECLRAPRVLAALSRSATSRPAGELLDHLVECVTCRELALVYRASRAGAEAPRAPVPPRVESAVREALARTRARPPAARRTTWMRIVSRAIAAGLLVFVLPLAASQPLFDRPVQRIYAVPGESRTHAPRRGGERVWLHTDLLARAHLYALLGTTFDAAEVGDPWTAEWIEPGVDPRTTPPARREAGPIDVLADLPGGTLRARLVLLAASESLGADDLDALEAFACSADDVRARLELSELVRRVHGTAWCEDLVLQVSSIEHPSLHAEVSRLFERGDPSELRAWASEHPRRAQAAVAMLLERALDETDAGEEAFRRAERLVQELAPGEQAALHERVVAYRRWASSPSERTVKEDLDRRILRDACIHDESKTPFRALPTEAASASFYAEAARRYAELGDPWGRIESLVRQTWFEPDRAAAQALCDEILQLSSAHAYPRGEGQVLNLRAFWMIEKGAFDLARERAAFTRAFEILSDVREWEIAAIAASNLGFHLTLRGAVGEALPHLVEAARIQREHGLRIGEAVTLFKLSWAHREVGRAAEGATLAERALRSLRAHDGPEASADVLRFLVKGHAYAAMAARAAGLPQRALELRTEGEVVEARLRATWGTPDPDGLSRLRNAAACALLDEGRHVEGLELAIDAQRTYDDPWQVGMALVTQSIALRRLGRSEEALAALEGASRTLGRQTEARLDWLDVLHAMAELQEERGSTDEAVATRLTWLATIEEVLSLNDLSALDQAFLRERFRPGFVAGVRLALALQTSGRGDAAELALRFMEGARPAPGAWSEDAESSAAESLDLSDLRSLLEDGVLWLEYLHGTEDSYLLVVDAAEARILSLGLGVQRAAALLDALDQSIGEGAAVDAIAQRGREAFDALLGPVAEAVRGGELLLLSLDPGLWMPRFEILVDPLVQETPGEPEYLLLRHPIAYLPSARFFVEVERDPPARAPRASFLGITSPSPRDGSGGSHASPTRELEDIARLFASGGFGADVRDGLEDGLATLRDGLLSQYRYVHFLADGYESSALDVASSGAAQPALLGIAQVADLPPLAAELVVLASGGSAHDPSGAASRWWGLPGAFLFRGARSVLVDTSGAWEPSRHELLLRFYEALFRPMSKAEALREAKLSLLRGASSRVGRRDDWSSLVLMGSPR